MKVLIAEDDENKRLRLVEHVSSLVGAENVTAVGSMQGAIRAAAQGTFALLVLDMSMPTFDYAPDDDGGRPQAYGGREVLRQIKRRRLSMKSVVVTQFDRFGEGDEALELAELNEALAEEHGIGYLGSIFYDVRSGEWRASLAKTIEAVLVSESRGA